MPVPARWPGIPAPGFRGCGVTRSTTGLRVQRDDQSSGCGNDQPRHPLQSSGIFKLFFLCGHIQCRRGTRKSSIGNRCITGPRTLSALKDDQTWRVPLMNLQFQAAPGSLSARSNTHCRSLRCNGKNSGHRHRRCQWQRNAVRSVIRKSAKPVLPGLASPEKERSGIDTYARGCAAS